MALPQIKINSNWMLLGVAAVLGIGAVYVSNSMLSRRMAEIEEEATRGKKFVEVVVAKTDLEKGEPINADVVAIRKIPKEYVHASAIRPDQYEQVESQRLAAPLKKGESLLATHLEGNGAQVFSATLRKGLRALTFEVDAVNSISGMLRPGDRIDLIYSGKASSGTEHNVTVPLLSNVQVLATDQNLTKQDENGQQRNFSTITLELTPIDADRVIVAKAAGQLTAVLRHPDDEAVNATRMLSAAQLIHGQISGAKEQTIEFIVGGSGGGPAEVQIAEVAGSLRPATLNSSAPAPTSSH